MVYNDELFDYKTLINDLENNNLALGKVEGPPT